jgi:hypothetical protein
MPELDAMNPGMGQQPASTEVIGLPDGEADREGAMAKADLYKLASYSHKLFQQIQDEDQLEGWVQAKITKAADYIASVYHYLEYEMKFSEYGKQLDDSDVLSEGQKSALKNKLMEAKAKVKELKKAQAEKVKEGTTEVQYDKEGKRTGVKHTSTHKYTDEPHAEPASKVKARSAADKAGEKAQDKAAEKESKAYEKAHPGTVSRYKDGKKVNEASKLKGNQTKLDADDDGDIEADDLADLRAGKKKKVAEATKEKCCCEEKGKSKCPVHGKVEEAAPRGQKSQDSVIKIHQISKSKSPGANLTQGAEDALEKGNHKKIDQIHQYATTTTPTGRAKKVSEAKPSAGLSAAKKSAVVKDAKAGKDIGKPGKSFDKVAAKAGGGEKGKKIAAAAMWKNMKEDVKLAEAEKKAKKDYDEDGKVETGAEEHAGSVDKAIKASKEKETVKESADMTRMKQFLTRLNG